jgi:ribokinase
VKHRPGLGETVFGSGFGMFLGGKGFNQAVACRRLGAEVTMVGRVGSDVFGVWFLDRLVTEGIDATHVRRDPETGTGVACPLVDETGQNAIIGVPRANMRVSLGDVDDAAEKIAAADVLMLQFEIPLEASRHAAGIARKHGAMVMLDPAPVHHAEGVVASRPLREQGVGEALSLRSGWLSASSRVPVEDVDYIVPNEVEAQMLTGRVTAEEQAAVLLPETRRGVVISLGAAGAFAADRASLGHYPGHAVNVVDTTGAGDAFRAGLATKLAEGASLAAAVAFANACGALACTVLGAEPSMPGRAEVERLLAAQE